jgi:hypothetical protein
MASEIDIDTLTGPAAPVEHCGKPMRWLGGNTTWEGRLGEGFQQDTMQWACDCGATLSATVRVPS